MANLNEGDLGRELGKAITAIAAPEELELYDEIVEATSKPRTERKDNPLGFGVAEGLTSAVAAIAYAAGAELIRIFWEAIKPSLATLAQDTANEMRSHFSQKIKNWIASGFKEPPPARMNEKQREKFVEKWLLEATNNGLSDTDIDKLHAALRTVTEHEDV